MQGPFLFPNFMPKSKQKKITGWGRYFRADTEVFSPTTIQETQVMLAGYAIARGGGMSYGDASLNHGGRAIQLIALHDKTFDFDVASGILSCSAAWTQREILAEILPWGWMIPAVPGSREITIGGMIAADAHGKNHFRTGTIGRHLLETKILTASGDVLCCTPNRHADLFWATIGGLGLTGIVTEVKLQLQAIPSLTIASKYHGFAGVDSYIDVVEANTHAEFNLGWANGRYSPNREFAGAATTGDYSEASDTPKPWAPDDFKVYALPFPNPLPGAGWLAAQALNSALKRKFVADKVEHKSVQHFFFPQDAIRNWNVAYGFRGFVEYHCCLPLQNGKPGLADLFDFLRGHKVLVALTALKRFGPALVSAPLSFPSEGYSVALDIPVSSKTFALLDELDQIVVGHGGRVNLVKDSRLSPEMVRKMYPRLDDWLKVKRAYDPKGVFSSGLSRRLQLE